MDSQAIFNPETHENNLFEFHLDSYPIYDEPQHVEEALPMVRQPFYPYFSETAPNAQLSNGMFSSPQLKPINSSPTQRKRFKTMAITKNVSEPLPNVKHNQSEKKEEEDLGDDDSSSDSDSNDESTESNKRRGKYKIYTEVEKATILNFLLKHGIQKTLDIFSNSTHKITKRKLKSWMDSQHKVKGVKGRKTNDPNRDQTLYDWCLLFQKECGRAPTRKEATKKALELSEDPQFQASKGWLDKFSRKYNIEFTPLKIIPPKTKKLTGLGESDSNSTVSNSETSCFDGMSPIMQALQSMQPQQQGKELQVKPWNLEGQVFPAAENTENYDVVGHKINSYFNFTSQANVFDGINFDNRDYNGLQQFKQPLNGNFGFFSAISNGYQPDYPVNNQFNMSQSYIPSNEQQNYEINGFLNFGNNCDDYYGNEQMKLEHKF